MGAAKGWNGQEARGGMPSWMRWGIALFNLGMLWVFWMVTSSLWHTTFCCGTEYSRTTGAVVMYAINMLAMVTAGASLAFSCICERWGQVIWRGAQLRLAVVCSGQMCWGGVDLLLNLGKAMNPGIGITLVIITGVVALSIFCALLVRQYVE